MTKHLTTDLAALLAARPALEMHAFDGLCFEGVPLNAVADEFGTPAWVYGAASLRARYRALTAAFAAAGQALKIHYAVKANDHLAILSLLQAEGAGADVVSLGEFLRARAAGIAPADIVFSGVGKTAAELRAALAGDVGQINIESGEELEMLSAIAGGMGVVADIVLRVNPDVDAGTHEKISTGRAGDKFGVPAADVLVLYGRAAEMPGVRPVGLAMHIGSQILDLAPFATAYGKAAELVLALRTAGQVVERLDLGGGLGIGYGDDPGMKLTAFAQMVRRETAGLDVALMLEPGRYLVGPAGILLVSVILQKLGGGKRFVVVDAAMNDLLRPALYGSWHGILPVGAADYRGAVSAADVVGPVCETGDCFAQGRLLPGMPAGARAAVLDAGAYGAVMSSLYNARPRAAAVMIENGTARLITPRQRVEEMWAHEVIP